MITEKPLLMSEKMMLMVAGPMAVVMALAALLLSIF
jgi:hypothetical protein